MRSLGYCNYPLKLLEPPQISHPRPSTLHYPGLRITKLELNRFAVGVASADFCRLV